MGVASSSRVQIDIVTRGIDQTKKSSDGATKNIGRVEKATRRSTKAMKKGKAELTGFRAKLKGLGDEAFALKNLFGSATAILGGMVKSMQRAALVSAQLKNAFGGLEESKSAIAAVGNAFSMEAFGQGVNVMKNAGVEMTLTSEHMEKLADVATTMGMTGDQAFKVFSQAVAEGNPDLLKTTGLVMKGAIEFRNYAKSMGRSARTLTLFEKQTLTANMAIRAIERSTVNASTAFNKLDMTGKKVANAWAIIQEKLITPVASKLAEGILFWDDYFGGVKSQKGAVEIRKNFKEAVQFMDESALQMRRALRTVTGISDQIAKTSDKLRKLRGDMPTVEIAEKASGEADVIPIKKRIQQIKDQIGTLTAAIAQEEKARKSLIAARRKEVEDLAGYYAGLRETWARVIRLKKQQAKESPDMWSVGPSKREESFFGRFLDARKSEQAINDFLFDFSQKAGKTKITLPITLEGELKETEIFAGLPGAGSKDWQTTGLRKASSELRDAHHTLGATYAAFWKQVAKVQKLQKGAADDATTRNEAIKKRAELTETVEKLEKKIVEHVKQQSSWAAVWARQTQALTKQRRTQMGLLQTIFTQTRGMGVIENRFTGKIVKGAKARVILRRRMFQLTKLMWKFELQNMLKALRINRARLNDQIKAAKSMAMGQASNLQAVAKLSIQAERRRAKLAPLGAADLARQSKARVASIKNTIKHAESLDAVGRRTAKQRVERMIKMATQFRRRVLQDIYRQKLTTPGLDPKEVQAAARAYKAAGKISFDDQAQALFASLDKIKGLRAEVDTLVRSEQDVEHVLKNIGRLRMKGVKVSRKRVDFAKKLAQFREAEAYSLSERLSDQLKIDKLYSSGTHAEKLRFILRKRTVDLAKIEEERIKARKGVEEKLLKLATLELEIKKKLRGRRNRLKRAAALLIVEKRRAQLEQQIGVIEEKNFNRRRIADAERDSSNRQALAAATERVKSLRSELYTIDQRYSLNERTKKQLIEINALLKQQMITADEAAYMREHVLLQRRAADFDQVAEAIRGAASMGMQLDSIAQKYAEMGSAAGKSGELALSSGQKTVIGMAKFATAFTQNTQQMNKMLTQFKIANKKGGAEWAKAAESAIMVGGQLAASVIDDEKTKAAVLAAMEGAAAVAAFASGNIVGGIGHTVAAGLYGAVAGTAKQGTSTPTETGSEQVRATGGELERASGSMIVNINAPVISGTQAETGAMLGKWIDQAKGAGFGG